MYLQSTFLFEYHPTSLMDAAQRSSSFPSFFKVPCIFLHNDYAFNVFVILVSSLTQNIRERRGSKITINVPSTLVPLICFLFLLFSYFLWKYLKKGEHVLWLNPRTRGRKYILKCYLSPFFSQIRTVELWLKVKLILDSHIS